MWGELSSELGELSSQCGASCLGASFLWGELSWGELSLGRVVRNPYHRPMCWPTIGYRRSPIKIGRYVALRLAHCKVLGLIKVIGELCL